MVAEYKVITGIDGIKEFTDGINAAIKEGWQPIGGIATSNTKYPSSDVDGKDILKYFFYQALVR